MAKVRSGVRKVTTPKVKIGPRIKTTKSGSTRPKTKCH